MISLELNPELEHKLASAARETGESASAIVNRALLKFFQSQDDVAGFRDLMERLQYIQLRGPYTRDELNERR